jgi:uncharacterized sporulation protein YeaH/YhbH (DUF444 family)
MPPGGDIAEMCFVVLMDATNDQDQDLQMIMNQVRGQTQQKQGLRNQINIVNRDATGMATAAATPSASTTEMSEMASQLLQMEMARRSQFVEALSNILKNIESTQATIIDNLK